MFFFTFHCMAAQVLEPPSTLLCELKYIFLPELNKTITLSLANLRFHQKKHILCLIW